MILVKHNMAIKALYRTTKAIGIASIQEILVKDDVAFKAKVVYKRELERFCITPLDFAYQHCCCWPTP